MLSKASHDNLSCSQSGGIVGVLACYYSSHHSDRGGVDEKGGNGAPFKYRLEDAAFQTSRDLGEIREMKFLGSLERTRIGWMPMVRIYGSHS